MSLFNYNTVPGLAVLLSVVLGGFWVQAPLAAAQERTISTAERQQLLNYIATLEQEVARLEAILEARRTPAREIEVYGSRVRLESSYQVMSNGGLYPTPRRAVDQELLWLWNGIVGTSTTVAKVDYWQIFNDRSTELGAYVETEGWGNDWRVSINRAEYDHRKQAEREAFAELFVHEYAHILLFDFPEITEAFASRFWSVRDYAHSDALEGESLDEMIRALERYYEDNQTRFVSDYATVSLDEDVAETFLTLVLNPASAREQSTLADKQRFLMIYPVVRTAVVTLRANLDKLQLK